MKKIVLIDTFAVGTFHEIFNSAFLKSVLVSFNDIQYWGTKSSIENQRKILSEVDLSSVSYCKVWNTQVSGLVGLLCRYIFAAISCICILRKIDKHSRVVVLNNNPFLSLLYPFIKREINIVCHGEMELLEGRDNGRLAKFMSYLLRRALIKKTVSSNLRFIVLGDAALNNLKFILPPGNYKQFSSIDHPYLFKKVDIRYTKYLSYPLNVGIIGITTPTKGKSFLKQLLISKSSEIEIVHIGKIDDSNNELKNLGLKIVKRDENNELQREEYEAWIKKMDFVLFLYPTDSYRLTASGAIFECISLGIPTISLRNDYFDYLRAKVGDFGLFYDSYEELKSFFVTSSQDNICFSRFDESILKGRNIFSPEFVGQTLSDKLY